MMASQPALRVSTISKIVSGGQTGVDRAALDFAISRAMNYGGWVPKGRKAEDGPISPSYRLTETKTSGYAERTRKNVIDSDGTLIIYEKELLGGTARTYTFARKTHKHVLTIDVATTTLVDAVKMIRNWISQNRISVLNVAGPRESEEPGIYEKSRQLLEAAFGYVESDP